MKKKILTLALIIAAIASASACSDNKESTGGNSSVSAELSQYEPIEGKDYEYNWVFYQLTPIADNARMIEYWEEKFGIKINVWDIEQSQMTEILNQRIMSGEVPDYFYVANPSILSKFVDQGVVAELPREVLDTYAPNMVARITEDVPDALEVCSIDGKIYGLPNYSTFPARNPVVWRGDWLKNVGIDKVPETIDEFEDAIYKFTFNDPDGNGKDDTYGMSNTIMTAVYGAYGYIPIVAGANTYTQGNWQERNGKLVFSAIQPEMKLILKRMSKWYADGVIDPEFITGENQGGYWALSHAFINGRIGVTGMGNTYNWQPRFYEDSDPGQNIAEMEKINPEGAASVVIGKPPVGPEGKCGTWANSYIRADRYCFGSGLQEEPDKLGKILQLFDYVYENPDNYNLAINGIEGEMYEKVSRTAMNGKEYTVFKPIGKYTDQKQLSANFAHVALRIFSPSFKTFNQSQGPNWDWEYSVESDKYRYTNELLVSLESEGKYQAELTKLVEETYIAIITGNKPIDYFDEFVEMWKQQGGEQLTKEANEWYASTKGE